MKRYIINAILASIILLSVSPTLHANEMIERKSKYDKRITRYRTRWEKMIPTHAKIQYAGNMGFLSFGTGWDYGKNNQWETDVFLGFIPKYDSDHAKVTFTLKQNFLPWRIEISPTLTLLPFTCGLYFNTVFGEEFWVKEPERYPEGYYGFSSKIRTHIYVGQQIAIDIAPNKRRFAKSMAFFYELSTCDLYLVSAVTNRYLRPRDYLGLSFGLKLQLF